MRAALLAACVLTGCAGMPPTGEGIETIQFHLEPGFCMGRCPYFDVTVLATGKAKIRYYRVDGRGERMRYSYVRPEEFAAFRARLAPYRPDGDLFLDDEAHCKELMTDQPRLHVTWTGSGPPARLIYDYGCDYAARREWSDALMATIDVLNLGELPGR